MGSPPHRRTWVVLLSLTLVMSAALTGALVTNMPTDAVTWWALAALVFIALPTCVVGVRATRKQGDRGR